MYMNKWSMCLLLVLMLMLGACSSDKKDGKKGVTAKAQSAPYELLVVADKEWLKTTAGQSLMVVVESPVEVLPQVEPCFRVPPSTHAGLMGCLSSTPTSLWRK